MNYINYNDLYNYTFSRGPHEQLVLVAQEPFPHTHTPAQSRPAGGLGRELCCSTSLCANKRAAMPSPVKFKLRGTRDVPAADNAAVEGPLSRVVRSHCGGVEGCFCRPPMLATHLASAVLTVVPESSLANVVNLCRLSVPIHARCACEWKAVQNPCSMLSSYS